MGKVTQLIFGGLSPGARHATKINLMARISSPAPPLPPPICLTDLKSGYLLGPNPRKQFLAQFSGIFVGTVVTVLCFRVLVPDASMLGTANSLPLAQS